MREVRKKVVIIVVWGARGLGPTGHIYMELGSRARAFIQQGGGKYKTTLGNEI